MLLKWGCGVVGCAGVSHPVCHTLRGRKCHDDEGGGEGLRGPGWQPLWWSSGGGEGGQGVGAV
jgi:hypothetical protein